MHSRLKATRFLVPLAVAALALAGCGGGKETAPAAIATADPAGKKADATPAPASEKVDVKIGGTKLTDLKNLPFALKGWGEDKGLVIKWTELQGGTKSNQALMNGEVDFAVLVADQVLTDISGKMRIIAVMTRNPGSAVLISPKDKDKIKAAQDLMGKKVGISSKGSGSHKFTSAWLLRSGVQPDDVIWTPGKDGPGERLSKGEVEAVYAVEPEVTAAVDKGTATVLVDARRPEGVRAVYGADEVAWIVLVTTDEMLKTQSQVVNKVVEALVESMKFVATGDLNQVIARVPPDHIKDAAMYSKVLETYRLGFVADGKVRRPAVEALWRQLETEGAVKRGPVPWDTITDGRFAG